MLKLFKSFIGYTEAKNISISYILFSVFAVATVRNLFELLYKFGYIFPKPTLLSSYLTINTFFVHFNSFWLAVYLSLAVILYLFTYQNNTIQNVLKFSMFSMFIILFPVLFDYLIGNKDMMVYPNDPRDLFFNIKYYFSLKHKIFGLSPGMRYEVFIVTVFSGLYVYIKNNKIFSAIAASFVVFAVISAFGLWVSFFAQIYENGFNFKSDFLFTTSKIFSTMQLVRYWAMSISLVYILLIAGLLAFVLFAMNKSLFNVIISNFRLTRIIHYLLLFFAGLAISKIYFLQQGEFPSDFRIIDALKFTNPYDILSVISGAVAVIFAFESAVIFNDYYDYKIDVVSNPQRPLVSGAITVRQYLTLGFMFLFFSLYLAFTISNAFFFFLLGANLFAFFYSNEPFRLKKYFLLNNFLIGLISLFVFMTGASMLLGDRAYSIIPARLSYAIVIGYTIVSTFKDLKDYQGDKQNGIQTIVTVFGEKSGKIIITTMLALTILLLPLFLDIQLAIWLRLVFAAALVAIMCFVKNNENYVFGLYYLYVAIIFVRFMLNVIVS